MREDLYEEAFARMKKAAGVSGTANCNLTKLKRISSFKNCTSCLDYYTRVQNVWSGSKSVVTFGLIKILTHPC